MPVKARGYNKVYSFPITIKNQNPATIHILCRHTHDVK